MPEIGDVAPDFTLPSHQDRNKKVSLSEFKGKKNVVIAFHPLAFTPVCSAQMPAYEKDLERFHKADTEVLSISVDAQPSKAAWAKELVAGGGGYLFLDELTTSPPAVQAAMLAVALDLTVGDVQLPKGTRVIAGANPPDCAAGGYELEAPLANRFCHVEFTPSVDEWLDGMSTGWGAPPASRAVATDEQRACVGAQFDHRLCAAQS